MRPSGLTKFPVVSNIKTMSVILDTSHFERSRLNDDAPRNILFVSFVHRSLRDVAIKRRCMGEHLAHVDTSHFGIPLLNIPALQNIPDMSFARDTPPTTQSVHADSWNSRLFGTVVNAQNVGLNAPRRPAKLQVERCRRVKHASHVART